MLIFEMNQKLFYLLKLKDENNGFNLKAVSYSYYNFKIS